MSYSKPKAYVNYNCGFMCSVFIYEERKCIKRLCGFCYALFAIYKW